MKKLILFTLFLALLTISAYEQNRKSTLFKIKYPAECKLVKGNDSIEDFYISSQPITNRAYIIYMNWLMNCYTDYPEQWHSSWPDFGKISGEIDYSNCKYFVEMVNNSSPLIKKYMYNPEFIDYPVLGLNWYQANNFCKWLSDRYNEYILMKHGYLSEDAMPMYENCFTTESFLASQYERSGKKEFKDITTGEPGIRWEHHLLVPSFRLPTELESSMAKKNKLTSDILKAYPLPEFLKPWQCLKQKGNKLIMTNCVTEKNEEYGFTTINSKPPTEKVAEWFLDTYLKTKNNSLLTIFSNLGQKQVNYEEAIQIQKDSIGKMRYMILTEKNKKVIAILAKTKLPEISIESINKYTIFRYAVSAVKED